MNFSTRQKVVQTRRKYNQAKRQEYSTFPNEKNTLVTQSVVPPTMFSREHRPIGRDFGPSKSTMSSVNGAVRQPFRLTAKVGRCFLRLLSTRSF